MNTKFSELIQNAEQLLAEGEYHKVVSSLELINCDSLSESDQAFCQLLYCHASLFLGEINIEDRLDQAIEFYRTSTENDKYALVKYLQGWYLGDIGDFLAARESLTEAYAAYKRIRNFKGQGIVLNRMSYFSLKIGDSRTAISNLKMAIKIYKDNNNLSSMQKVMINLASVLYIFGKISESLSIYESLKSIEQTSQSEFIYLYNFPMPIAMRGDFLTAKEAMKNALAFSDDFIRDKAIYYENLGWIHLLAEEYQPALEALQQGLNISMEIAPKSDLVSQIKRRIADAYFGLKQYDKAKQFADEALQVSEHLNERVEIAACWRVFAQLDAIAGKEQSAREWFARAIEMFAMIESNYDLAVTRYTAATSGLYRNGEQRALLYLAREYFASEDVQYFVEKIDAEFKKSSLAVKPVKPSKDAPIVIAESAKMKKIIETSQVMSQSHMAILLTGETGTGKDLLARYIHDCSGCKGAFVPVNIAAIPESMLEAELFGYRKGAFTGAGEAKAGLLELANDGTFFLNEVNSAPAAIQAKLLEILEHRKVRRLGENIWRDVSFRLISATNHNLEELIRSNQFRSDFYHRIKQVEIALPSLIERPEDIPALIRHFLSQVGMACDESQAQAIAQQYESYPWPGNVRELKAEIEKLAVLSGRNIEKLLALLINNDESEKARLLNLLEKHDWNRTKAAEVLNVSEGTIRYRMKKYNIEQL